MPDQFFAALSDGICISDTHGVILYMNPAAERLLGVSFANTQGKTLCDILCGHLCAGGSSECASTCLLRKPASPVQAVTFQGSYGPVTSYSWSDFRSQRCIVFENLRVRCLKTALSFIEEGRHLTIIQNVAPGADAP